LTALEASTVCQTCRKNRAWTLIETAQILEEVWSQATESGLAFRRIIDLRLAQTLRHYGVTDFVTSNVTDVAGQ